MWTNLARNGIDCSICAAILCSIFVYLLPERFLFRSHYSWNSTKSYPIQGVPLSIWKRRSDTLFRKRRFVLVFEQKTYPHHYWGLRWSGRFFSDSSKCPTLHSFVINYAVWCIYRLQWCCLYVKQISMSSEQKHFSLTYYPTSSALWEAIYKCTAMFKLFDKNGIIYLFLLIKPPGLSLHVLSTAPH